MSFHKNPSGVSCLVAYGRTERRRDTEEQVVAFCLGRYVGSRLKRRPFCLLVCLCVCVCVCVCACVRAFFCRWVSECLYMNFPFNLQKIWLIFTKFGIYIKTFNVLQLLYSKFSRKSDNNMVDPPTFSDVATLAPLTFRTLKCYTKKDLAGVRSFN
jgi:hypothetical protein